jgi:endonuclease/exonuclease/phosphatase (EEP) superfamily protein YafD
MTWNLFHGRDWPPEPELQARAHKGNCRRGPRLGKEYEQTNWDLFDEFASVIDSVAWDVALFQEFPPRWSRRMSKACGAGAHRALSGRNWLQPITSLAAGGIAERRREVLTWRPELRVMALTRLEAGPCVANLHVSTKPSSAEAELLAAAERAVAFAGSAPLIFGGDFNVRPKASEVFERLEERFGLAPSTASDRLSHLLVRGLEVVKHPEAWPPEARDRIDPETGKKIRLSDHNPVIGELATVE